MVTSTCINWTPCTIQYSSIKFFLAAAVLISSTDAAIEGAFTYDYDPDTIRGRGRSLMSNYKERCYQEKGAELLMAELNETLVSLS